VLPGELAEVAPGPPAATPVNAEAATKPARTKPTGTKDLGPLIDAVTYCMQSETASHLRGNASEFLESAVGGQDMKYFKRKRLTKLDLPGRLEIPSHRKGLSSAKRRLRTQAKHAQHTLKTYGISIDAPKLVPKMKSTLSSRFGGGRKQ
ncbi:MAG: hypothetical protein L0J17_16040, partial [Brevibacterium sp.]|nr:hypothetical protein [Brevibacterium sp.]MDN6176894.1 hypothetical protein [Brevibacterium sp.]MDN6667834.1 hypothetical protein [Brevibacterium sp.]